MPKLTDQDVARNQDKIERAALRMFIKQGFHGASIREIAKASGVSVGNIYNYYKTKEELFGRICGRYEERMEKLRAQAFGSVDGVFTPQGLNAMAGRVKEIVYGNPDYWRLMYIDVVEFGNRHFAGSFRSLAKNLEARLGDRLREATKSGPWNGVSPSLAFTAIYLQFFTYFLVEKLFGGRQHLGLPDDAAVEQLIHIATKGLWGGEPKTKSARE